MYVTDFICTYNRMECDENDLSHELYQIQLLQAFNIKEFDDKIVNEETEILYEKYKNNTDIVELIDYRKNELMIDDNLILFRSFFAYDNFFKFHSLLCSLINK